MEQFPEWVPEEIVNYYRQLHDHGHPKNSGLDQSDILVLRRCMESRAMEKAWQAINRRKKKSDPTEFASLIVWTSMSSRKMNTYPTSAEIAGYKKLLEKTRALSRELEATLDLGSDARRKKWSGDSAIRLLEDLAADFDMSAAATTITRKRLTMLSGKPQSKNSKRTYVIRCLSETVRQLYGQPLHKVVALTSSEILKERVDGELARKLVS